MQTSINTALATGLCGQLYNASTAECESYVNNTTYSVYFEISTGTALTTIELDGTDYTVNSACAALTIAAIVPLMATAINAGSGDYEVLTANITSTTLTVQSTVYGDAFTYSATANIATSGVTFQNEASVPFGRLVVQDNQKYADVAHLPYTSAQVTSLLTLGVTIRDNVFDDSDDLGYTAQSTMAVLRKGQIWVTAENAVTPHTAVYARHTVTTTNTAYGTFRGDTDSATASLVSGAVWKTQATAGGTALLQINLP